MRSFWQVRVVIDFDGSFHLGHGSTGWGRVVRNFTIDRRCLSKNIIEIIAYAIFVACNIKLHENGVIYGEYLLLKLILPTRLN